MRIAYACLTVSVLLALTPALHAEDDHEHADLLPYVTGGVIHTGARDHASSFQVENVRVFGFDVDFDDVPGIYWSTDAGINNNYGVTPPALPGTLPADAFLYLRVTGPLTFWDGTGLPAFGTPAHDERLRLLLGASAYTVTGASGPQEGFFIQKTTGGAVHKHVDLYLWGADGDGDETNGGPIADGVYLLPTQLYFNPAVVGAADSATLYWVLNKGLDEEQHEAAIIHVRDAFAPGTNLVPEPASLALLGLSGLLVLRRRRAA